MRKTVCGLLAVSAREAETAQIKINAVLVGNVRNLMEPAVSPGRLWLSSRISDHHGGKSMNQTEYFFYEWLILGKKMTQEEFEKLSKEELERLKLEFIEFYKSK